MRSKRTKFICCLIAFLLASTIALFHSAQTNEVDGDDAANVVAASGSQTGTEKGEKRGNRFARVLKSPFRAIGRIFGGGKREGKVERLNERDVARFESAGVARIEDVRSREDEAAGDSSNGTARDHLERGRELLSKDRLNEAIRELSRATSLDPRLKEAHNLLGVAYDRKGLSERAKDSYSHALDAAPEDVETLNNLGYSLYLNGNYRRAVDRLKRAARLAPRDERVLNNLALAQFRLGKFDDALRNFAKANGELTGRLNMAALFERTGQSSDAITQYEAARRLQPNSNFVLRHLVDLYKQTGRDAEAETARQALASVSNETAARRNNN
ncbi:MAG: tetratricopeptide repeat protein [Pyrinomonadaceae bacterium]|nr:tetratricopeptide repeat protein [Pyrinomonadaceae bacterium]